MTNPLLEVSPVAADEGELIGRDPRTIPEDEWQGRPWLSGLSAIRAKCMDCAHTFIEVRKCVQTDCPLWPLRMGSAPKGYRNAAMPARQQDTAPAGTPIPEQGEPDKTAGDGAEKQGETR